MTLVAKWMAFSCFGLVLTGTSASAQSRALSCAVEVAPSDSGSGRIGDVAVGPGNRLAWTDGRPGQVMVRDAKGRVRAIGRSGAGPAEFRAIASLGWWRDTLWVGDASVPRVQFFSDSGAYLYGITATTRAAWAPRPGGDLVGFAPRRLSGDAPSSVLRHSPAGAATVALFPLVPAPRVMLPNSGPRGNPQPFAAETVVGASPDHSRFCAARPTGGTWQVDCVDDSGNQLMRTTVSPAGRALTDALFDSMVVIFSQGRDEAEVRRRLSRPALLPAINSLLVANTGEVWLQRTHRFERAAIWLPIARDGKPRQQVNAAPLTRLLLVAADSAWGVRADEDGLESLLRCAVHTS